MGLQVEVSLTMNWLTYCKWPKNSLISFSLGGGMFNMALFFMGQPLSLYYSLGSLVIFLQSLRRYTFMDLVSTYTP